MLSAFIDTEYTTERLIKGSGKYVYIANSSGVGHLRQSSDELTRLNDLQFGELWELYVESDADIATADRVTIDSVIYLVKGMKLESFGGIDFKRLILTKAKS